MALVTKDLGFFGIFKASFIALFSQTKLFLKISLTFLLPLAIIAEIFSIFALILLYSANPNEDSPHLNSKHALIVFLFAILAIIAIIILSLLSIAAIVTSIAQIHLQIPLNFTAIIKRTPRILKKLAVTFLWCFLLLVLYHLIFSVIFALVLGFLYETSLKFVLFVVFSVVYLVGIVYLYNVISLANVVTVLELDCGRAAIVKSRSLLRGKRAVAAFVLVALGLLIGGVQLGLALAEFGYFGNGFLRVLVGVASCGVSMAGALLDHVIYGVLYFVCKFHKGEDINGTLLAVHLDSYLGIKQVELGVVERV